MKAWVTPGTSRRTQATEPRGGGEGRGGDGQLRHARGECRRRCARARYPFKFALRFLGESCRWCFGSQAGHVGLHRNLVGGLFLCSGFSWLVGSLQIAKDDFILYFCCHSFWFISIIRMSILLQTSTFLEVHSKLAGRKIWSPLKFQFSFAQMFLPFFLILQLRF